MSRSLWKGPYIDSYIWKKIKKVTSTSSQTPKSSEVFAAPLVPQFTKGKDGGSSHTWDVPSAKNNDKKLGDNKIWSRRSMILPTFIGNKYQIYNGNKWINLTINQDLIGHYFGEFAWTKKIAQYKRKSKIKKKGK